MLKLIDITVITV